ncbi:hypothetical protein CEY04_02700 [Achromobacter sp. HZ28]|nr:hypothetical protein CEY05_02700 [Achromobacter sp. HZ34]OWT82220.1 hypothetical protein CEY04_02700 [Achromobacter sp. HZ28]
MEDGHSEAMPMPRNNAACLILALALVLAGVAPCTAQPASPVTTSSKECSLQQIPDYEVLSMAYPSRAVTLVTDGRDAYLASLASDPSAIRNLRLLLALGESLADGSKDGMHQYFSTQAGALAPEVLQALRAAGMTSQAQAIEQGMAAFGSSYPTDDRKRDGFLAQSFLRIQEGIAPDFNKPPTATDNLLRQIGTPLADKTGYKAGVVDYMRRDPQGAALLAQAREHLTNRQRLGYLEGCLLQSGPSGFGDEATIRKGIETMPQALRTVYVMAIFSGELFNGGMHQFFSNSSGAFAPYVVQAMRDIGMPQAAKTVEQGMAMFPQPYPVSTEDRRRRAFQREWNSWDDKLDGLTGDVDGQDFEAAVAVYAAARGILPK